MTSPQSPRQLVIGVLHYDAPRAVKVREPGNLETLHSAIHAPIFVYTDTMQQADIIMSKWPEIMQAAADKAGEVLENALNE